MNSARRVLVVVLAILAVATGFFVVMLQYGLAEEYGAGPGTSVLPLAAIPIGFALAAAAVLRRAAGVVAGIAFSVLLVASVASAAPLGQREKERRAAERDATFACNRPSSEFLVPDGVDDGWDDFDHPFHLYGPISQSRYGCTAAIDGRVSETWGPWRQSLLEAGWEVERDDTQQVTVTDGVLRAALEQQDGLSVLTLETVIADACQRRDYRRPDPRLDARC